MNYKESLNDFDERSKEILMASAKSIIPIQKLQQRDYGNFRDVMVDKVKLGETIRGMQNVSPLTEMKFFNQSADQIFSKYFPDGEETLKGNVTIIDDFNIVVKEGYKFSSYDYYFDNNHNGIYGDSGDTLAFRLLLFVSDDGNKVKECYEVVKPADDEVILFLESDKDTFSQDALYGKMSDKVRKQFTDKDGNLKSNLFDNEIMKTVQKHSDINQDIVAELMKNGYVENKSITKGFFIFLKYVMMGVSAPAKALGWIMNKIGDGIDFLKIPDKFWDTESEDYYFRKDSLIENLSIPTNKLNTLKNLFTDKKGFNLADITPQLLDDIILKQISVLESFTEQYNNYVKAKIEEIFKNLENNELQKQTESLAEKVALICGIWNGLVDFISSIFKFISTLLEAPFDISKDFQYTFELVDNFLALLDENLLKNIDNAVSEGIKNIIEYLRSKNADDINFVRVYYLAGFTISFIGTFFIPIADVAKISEVGKVGEILTKINEEIGKTISQSAKFVKIQSAEVYQKAGKALQELLEMFAMGGKKLQDFVEKLWKEIAEWFLKNKELLKSAYDIAVLEGWKLLSKFFKTEKIINATNGVEIICFSFNKALVPIDKILMYARGRVRGYENLSKLEKDFFELKKLKQTQRKVFDSNPENNLKLKNIQKDIENINKSINNKKGLEKAGYFDDINGNKKVFDYVLAIANKNASNIKQGEWLIVPLRGPKGNVTTMTQWQKLSNGKLYLKTIKIF
ncbi:MULTISPECIES: hypothetical protein [Elizabethkingia]|nr:MULTISPECIES: hypothetical protein [Elizabethkingia]MDX8575432.1 hypothetical protein [Elizabethkingia sp. HX WYD]